MAGFLEKSLTAVLSGVKTFSRLNKKSDSGRTATDRDYMSMFSPSFMRANYDITFYQAIVYYCHVHPVATGVDTIADEFQKMHPCIYDASSREYIKEDHDLITLLNHPNADKTGWEFRKELAAYYKITGNVYIIATGSFPKPALELMVIQPQRVTMTPGNDGFVDTYNVSHGSRGAMAFKRREIKGRFRYFNEMGDELWHIRNFNPRFAPSFLFGLSELNAEYYEIEQFLQGNKHNLSSLNKGMRPSGVLSTEGDLTDDQRERIRASLNDNNIGGENAGTVIISDGTAKMEFTQMSQTPKDSDYLSNRSAVATSIFHRLKVPLALVSTDAQTYDNYKEARLALYDNAVLPLADFLIGELNLFLAPRYKLTPQQKLSYDTNDISALETRRAEVIDRKAHSGVLTINEIRTMYGYEAIEGGDELYQPMNMIAVGQDRYTADNLTKPANNSEDSGKRIPADRMRLILKRQIGPDGQPRFTNQQIDRALLEYKP